MIWKLLRQHISVAQLAGFFLANLCGMVIVLLGIQFYKDVLPVFTQGDSFMKKDYVIVSKQVSTLGSLVGKGGTFSRADSRHGGTAVYQADGSVHSGTVSGVGRHGHGGHAALYGDVL